MQPSTHPRPVMDVTAPPRPAVGATPPPSPRPEPETPPQAEQASEAPRSLPVQQAPVQDTDTPAEASDHQPQDNGLPADSPQDQAPAPDDAVEQAPMPRASQPSQQKDTVPLPVGAIVMTVLCMIALSAVAVMIYLKTQ